MAFFAGVSVISLSIALVFALKGYWMIFPFAGLEVLALGAALYIVADATRRRQVVSITATNVTVEKGRVCRGPDTRVELPRSWTQVGIDRPENARYHRRLWLGSSGRRVEIGEFLTDAEKESLAEQLRRLL